jgi:hypothetical protein
VELTTDGKKPRRLASLLPVLGKALKLDEQRIQLKDLFFWPNGDLGLNVDCNRENDHYSAVIRMESEGKRVKSFFKVDSWLDHVIGCMPDGSLVLKDSRGELAQYRNGEKVTSFSEAVKKIGKRIEIQASGMISPDKVAIAGRRLDKKNILEFVIIDPDGKEINTFTLANKEQIER